MDKTKRTTESQSGQESQPEPREAALSQVEHDTAGQQERVHRQAVREGQEKSAEGSASARDPVVEQERKHLTELQKVKRHSLRRTSDFRESTERDAVGTREVIAQADAAMNGPVSHADEQVTSGAYKPDTRTQAEKFADAAREHGADQSEDAFKGVLRKLAKPKAD